MAKKKGKKSERLEALMRIPVVIVSGIVLTVWRSFVYVLAVINLIYVIFTGKRLRELAELSELWNTQWYTFWRYIIFASNERPFPFKKLRKRISKFS